MPDMMGGRPWPYYEDDEIEAVVLALRSGHPNQWGGTKVGEFETRFSALVGCRYGIALANGTVALDAALRALGIGPGDEVVVTPRSFVASASCVAWAGATPVFADIDPDSQNITAETVSRVLSTKTRAIIPVHLGGNPCAMDSICALAREKGLFVIEDAAQAHGALWRDRPVGSWGDVAAWSFCQDKIISTGGEGGMVTTNDAALFEKIWSMKDHGRSREKAFQHSSVPGFRWLADSFGTNWRMTEMQAAIGLAQLPKLTDWLSKRRHFAQVYSEILTGSPSIRIPVVPEASHPAYYRFYAFVRPENLKPGHSRDSIIEEANKRGLSVMHGSCSEIYREKSFVDAFGEHPPLPNAKLLGETSLCFQTHHNLDVEAVRKNAIGIREVLDLAAKDTVKS